MQSYRRGDQGPAVRQVRRVLRARGLVIAGDEEQASFDTETERAVRAFQQERGLRVDGVVGPETFRALDEASWSLGDRVLSYHVSHPMVGDDVLRLQERLLELGFAPGRPDGDFGPRTESALRHFQREYGLPSDGTCGLSTFRALTQLGRSVRGGRPLALREAEQLHSAGSSLVGKKVVVDPGHGGGDTGAVSADGLTEADVVYALAQRLEGRLLASGVEAYLTRGQHGMPSAAERAGFANSAGAHVVLSLHCDSWASPHAQGVSTYFFGTVAHADSHSVIGEELADLVLREVASRTDLQSCRSHRKTWELLRRTAMPAVRLDLGYLSHPGDVERLRSPNFLDVVAEGVVVALQRLYLPAEADPTTGTLRLPAAV